MSEKFHFKRKNPTFRRAARSKMISLQDFPRIHTAVTKIFPRLPLPVQGRDRKILPALRTNQIAGFVTVPSCKKIMLFIFFSVRERAVFYKSCDLIGSGSGRYSPIRPAHSGRYPMRDESSITSLTSLQFFINYKDTYHENL